MTIEEYSEVIRNKLQNSSRYKIPPMMLEEIMKQIDPEIETIWEQGLEEGRKSCRRL